MAEGHKLPRGLGGGGHAPTPEILFEMNMG